jgi:hypothetical protein
MIPEWRAGRFSGRPERLPINAARRAFIQPVVEFAAGVGVGPSSGGSGIPASRQLHAVSSQGPSLTADSLFMVGINAAAITVPITATIPSFVNRFV